MSANSYMIMFLLFLLATAYVIPVSALSVASIRPRLGDSLRSRRVFQLLGAEFVDFACVALLVFLIVGGATVANDYVVYEVDSPVMAVVVVGVFVILAIGAFLGGAWMVAATGGTPGFLLARLKAVAGKKAEESTESPQNLSLLKAMGRNALYLLWLSFMYVLVGLPWLLGTPIVVGWKKRNLYDIVSGTYLEDIEPKTTRAQEHVSVDIAQSDLHEGAKKQ